MNPALTTALSVASQRKQKTTGRTQHDLAYEQLAMQRNDRLWRNVGIGAGVVVGAIVLKKVVDNISDRVNSRQETKEYKRQVDKQQLSKPKAWYRQAADNLYIALNAAPDDMDSIFEIIEHLQNPNDWYQLLVDFGVRQETGNWAYRQMYELVEGDLKHWLGQELSTAELNRIRQYLKTINSEF